MRVFDEEEVEPAAAAFSAGSYADFLADVLEFFAGGIELFAGKGVSGVGWVSGLEGCLRREGARADAGCVSFHDAANFLVQG